MIKKWLLLGIFFSTALCFAESSAKTQNPIVIFFSPPRSLSTACLRMMHAHGDFACLHEFFLPAFVKVAFKELSKDWYRPEIPTTFEEAKIRVFEHQKKHPVFLKEMSYVCKNFFLTDVDLVLDNSVHFFFLVRSPHHTIISLYKKWTAKDPILAINAEGFTKEQQEHFATFIGYKETYELFQNLKKRAVQKPFIIKAEDLYSKPESVAKALCKAIDIPFKNSMLSWESLDDSFTGITEWEEAKHPHFTHHWHGEALKSSGFHKPSSYKTDALGVPTFEEIEHESDRELCKKVYEETLLYYNLLLEETSFLLNP